MFSAVLDTCVLWPSLQRDVLLSFAVEGLYRPLWSSAILEELEHHEAVKLRRRGDTPDDAARRAAHLVSEMRRVFDDACVTGWEPLEGAFGLPDPDDEHVVAAAVVGGAGAVVTSNLRDFDVDEVRRRLHVLPPATFAADTASVDPTRALLAVAQVASRVRRPPMTVPQVLDALESRYGWHDAVDLMREA